MSDIELVIKISEIEYEHLTNKEKFYSLTKSKQEWLINKILDRVVDGTPLPKGHGRLMILSEDKLKENQINLDFSCQKWISEVGLSYATITIIEADKTEKAEAYPISENVEAIPKTEYENRLKADMVAMLTDIQLEIEEKKFLESSCFFMDKTEEKNYAVYTDEISKIIQQKIDALKVESEDKDENKFKIKL